MSKCEDNIKSNVLLHDLLLNKHYYGDQRKEDSKSGACVKYGENVKFVETSVTKTEKSGLEKVGVVERLVLVCKT